MFLQQNKSYSMNKNNSINKNHWFCKYNQFSIKLNIAVLLIFTQIYIRNKHIPDDTSFLDSEKLLMFTRIALPASQQHHS